MDIDNNCIKTMARTFILLIVTLAQAHYRIKV